MRQEESHCFCPLTGERGRATLPLPTDGRGRESHTASVQTGERGRVTLPLPTDGRARESTLPLPTVGREGENHTASAHCRERKQELVSCVQRSATPGTIQSMEFSRPEYWSGLPFPSPGDLPNPGIEPRSPTLQADSLPAEPPGKPLF